MDTSTTWTIKIYKLCIMIYNIFKKIFDIDNFILNCYKNIYKEDILHTTEYKKKYNTLYINKKSIIKRKFKLLKENNDIKKQFNISYKKDIDKIIDDIINERYWLNFGQQKPTFTNINIDLNAEKGIIFWNSIFSLFLEKNYYFIPKNNNIIEFIYLNNILRIIKKFFLYLNTIIINKQNVNNLSIIRKIKEIFSDKEMSFFINFNERKFKYDNTTPYYYNNLIIFIKLLGKKIKYYIDKDISFKNFEINKFNFEHCKSLYDMLLDDTDKIDIKIEYLQFPNT